MALRDRRDAESFYHLRGLTLAGRVCDGLACFAANVANVANVAQAAEEGPRVYCLGKCYAGPADADHDVRPLFSVQAREPVLLENLLAGGARDLAVYRRSGGGEALARARTRRPEDIVGLVEASALRGRGGAGFPTGQKWRLVASERAPRKYVVANADEGDPGAFGDRFLMEDDPFRLIEAMAIAAHAVGASHGYIYLRKEYPAAEHSLEQALVEARAAGWCGPDFDIKVVIGQGSYVCGEETAMLNSIEGRRPQVRLRPPQITQSGLFGMPTLVNNVETFCAIPWIVRHGAQAYAQLGFSASRGTKLLSLSSVFRRPGLYEVEFGMPLSEIVDGLGEGLRMGKLKALMTGGPLSGLLPPAQLDLRLGYEEMQAAGAAVGHGGVIAFTDDTSLAAIIGQVFRFGAYESCGKCVPCHRGSPAIARMFGSNAETRDPQRYRDIVHALAATSLCAHGRGLAEFAQSLQMHFPGELAACFA